MDEAAARLRQRLDEDGQLWRTAFEEGRRQGVREVRAYTLMDLWTALGREPADPEVVEPGIDQDVVWARALDGVRRLQAANERMRTEAARTHSDITDGARPAWQLAHRILRTLDEEAW